MSPYIPGGVKRPSAAVHPPSARRIVPVTKLAASDARNSVGPTISSARAHRPSALLFAYAAYHLASALIGLVSGVSTTPGPTAFTRTPNVPNSTAAVR